MTKADSIITIKVTISLWSAIKLRIAGFKEPHRMITAPLPIEPRPRSKDPPDNYFESKMPSYPIPKPQKPEGHNSDSTGARKHKPKGSEGDADKFEKHPYGPHGPVKHDPTKGSDDDVQ